MEVLKDISAIIGLILSAIALIGACTKGGRSLIKSIFTKNTEDLHNENKKQNSDIEGIKKTVEILLRKSEANEEMAKQQCRNIIKNIYYHYQKDKKIPLYERKTADRTYQIYTTLYKGNSYATLLYNEICKWDIDTFSFQDLSEE